MNECSERGAITREEQVLPGTKCGLGGGEYAAEFLCRAGVGRLTLVDGDVFIAMDLDRQFNAIKTNPGKNKAAETAACLRRVRSDLSVPGFAGNRFDTVEL